MEQMQASMMYMLQAVTAARSEAASRKETAGTAKKDKSEDRDFQNLMKKAQADKERPEKEGDAAGVRPEKPVRKMGCETEEELLQELAAMQNLYVEAGGLPVVQMTQPEAVQTGTVEQPMEVMQTPGQGVMPQETPAQTQADGPEMAPEAPAQPQPMEQAQQNALRENPQQQDAGASDEGMIERVRPQAKEGAAEQPENAQSPVFGQVETAPIKVGETTAPQTAEQPQSVETQVEEAVTEAIRQGESRVEIRLEPEQLGKVTVELTQREDGTIHVALRAENGETRSLLEKDLPGLQQLLSRNSQQEVQVEVPRNQESQQQDLQDGHQRQNHQQQEQRQRRDGGEDFLSRLRLGLVSQENEIL